MKRRKEEKMSTLYEITEEYRCLLEMLNDEDIDPQTLKDTLEGIEGEFEVKADGYAKVLKELEKKKKKFEAEIERMTAKVNIIKNNSTRLKQHLYNSMKSTDKRKFKTDLFTFNICKNGGLQPIDIIPGIKIPDEYCRNEPDNTKIREALKSGIELPFAVLKERGEHLTIK